MFIFACSKTNKVLKMSSASVMTTFPMRKTIANISLTILFLVMALAAQAQVTGIVIDRESGDTIPFASLLYKGHHVTGVG